MGIYPKGAKTHISILKTNETLILKFPQLLYHMSSMNKVKLIFRENNMSTLELQFIFLENQIPIKKKKKKFLVHQ